MGWLIVLWIFLAVTAILALVVFLPVGMRVRYHGDGLKLWYTVGPIRLLRYPEDAKAHEKRKNAKINLRTVLDEPIKANRKYDNLLGDFWAEFFGIRVTKRRPKAGRRCGLSINPLARERPWLPCVKALRPLLRSSLRTLSTEESCQFAL